MKLANYLGKFRPGFKLYGWILRCHGCNDLFWSSRKDAKWCSGACRQQAYRDRIREEEWRRAEESNL